MNDEVELFENNVAANSVMTQADYQSLGQLQKFLDQLSIWSKRLTTPVHLLLWQNNINELIDTFLQLDDDEEWTIKPVRDEIANWQQQVVQSSFNEQLDSNLIHYILQNAITKGSAHHHYLSGGINFCNLIPMRTLPFKVVCLISMGDDQFPRSEIPVQLDLISINPQKGDQSGREDDRYMFLQSLLSAEDRFYISYVGQNKKDDSLLEPSVVVTELLDHIEQTTGYRIPIIKTALQAFSDKNFIQGSYAGQWQIDTKQTPVRAFDQRVDSVETEAVIDLDDLIKFYKNPARHFMEGRLNISLNDHAESIQDDEIFTLDPSQRYSINNKLLNELFENGEVQTDKYLNSGELAELNSGKIQYEDLYQGVNEDFQKISLHPEFSGFCFIEGNLKLPGLKISGRVNSFSEKGLLQINQSLLKGKHVFSYWIQHCFLCAQEKLNFCEFYYKDQYKKEKLSSFPVLTVKQAKDYLIQLVDGYHQGKDRALPFYVDTSYEYEKLIKTKDETVARDKIQNLWQSDDFNPFYEAQDIYLKTSLKNTAYNAENFSPDFFACSSRFMSPLINIMEDIK